MVDELRCLIDLSRIIGVLGSKVLYRGLAELQLTLAPADKQYLGSSFSPSFRKGQGWITAGRTGGFGADGNADVDYLSWSDLSGTTYHTPIMTFAGGQGRDWFFHRRTPSVHNMSAPDIRIITP